MATYAGIIVTVNNQTAIGPITFGSLSFMAPGSGYEPTGYPPIISSVVGVGKSINILVAQAASDIGYTASPGGGGPASIQNLNPVTTGTAIFNMPNGDKLTISWDLNASYVRNTMPLLSPSSGYFKITGLTNPTITNGVYTFNLTISPNN